MTTSTCDLLNIPSRDRKARWKNRLPSSSQQMVEFLPSLMLSFIGIFEFIGQRPWNQFLFLSHPALCDLLTEEDQKVFKYLQSLDVEDFKDVKSGYSIAFTFRPNPYFEDTKLVKVFRFSDEGTTSISGSTVKWKDGMDLTNGVGPDKEGRKRPLQEESFFKWFSETQQKDPSDGIHDEVAEIIKEDLWPNPLKYFNNEADEEDYEDEDDNDDDDEEPGKGNDGSDEDDEEQDEDDEADDT